MTQQQLTTQQQAAREAVATAIRATGYDAMAADYLNRPEVRVRVLQAMRRVIERDAGKNAGDKFATLADQVQTMCGCQKAFAPVVGRVAPAASREAAMRSIAEAAARYRAAHPA